VVRPRPAGSGSATLTGRAAGATEFRYLFGAVGDVSAAPAILVGQLVIPRVVLEQRARQAVRRATLADEYAAARCVHGRRHVSQALRAQAQRCLEQLGLVR